MATDCIVENWIINMWQKNKILTIGIFIIVLIWIIIGYFLYKFDNNWISNWINSAVAIGTVTAVITSLYLANRKPNRSYFIDLVSFKFKKYVTNSIGFECEIINNVNFDINVDKVIVKIDGVVSISYTAAYTAKQPRTALANKILPLSGNLSVDDDGLLSDLTSKKSIVIEIHTDVYVYVFKPTNIKISSEKTTEPYHTKVVKNGLIELIF